tara:strand:- start:1433 stop:2524 length:1092 start_codon:yes stop_codon:yes gene_type:complete
MSDFFNLKAQYKFIERSLKKDLLPFLSKQNFILGHETLILEKKLSNYIGSKYCISCANGTDALTIALLALDLKKNSEVLIPAFNYISSSEVCLLLGYKPVFVDVNNRYQIDIIDLEKKISSKTKVIIPTSLFGRCCDYKNILKIAKKNNLFVIEDGAQSFGAKNSDDKRSCNVFDISCTSFFPTKPLGCYGDGGAIFTNNKKLFNSMKMISRHGQKGTFNHLNIGVNSRLDNLQSYFLLKKLKLFNKEIKNRMANYKKLLEVLSIYDDLVVNRLDKNEISSCAIFPILYKKRDKLIRHLNNDKVPTRIYYPKPIYNHPPYKKFANSCYNTEKITKTIFSIPFSPYLNDKYFYKLNKSLKNFFD